MTSQINSPNDPMPPVDYQSFAQGRLKSIVADICRLSDEAKTVLKHKDASVDWMAALKDFETDVAKVIESSWIDIRSIPERAESINEGESEYKRFVKSFEGRFQFSAKTFASKSNHSIINSDIENFHPQNKVKLEPKPEKQKSVLRAPLAELSAYVPNKDRTPEGYKTEGWLDKGCSKYIEGYSSLTTLGIFKKTALPLNNHNSNLVPSLNLNNIGAVCADVMCRDYWSMVYNQLKECKECTGWIVKKLESYKKVCSSRSKRDDKLGENKIKFSSFSPEQSIREQKTISDRYTVQKKSLGPIMSSADLRSSRFKGDMQAMYESGSISQICEESSNEYNDIPLFQQTQFTFKKERISAERDLVILKTFIVLGNPYECLPLSVKAEPYTLFISLLGKYASLQSSNRRESTSTQNMSSKNQTIADMKLAIDLHTIISTLTATVDAGIRRLSSN